MSDIEAVMEGENLFSDIPVEQGEQDEKDDLVRYVLHCLEESEQARWTRIHKSQLNRNVVAGNIWLGKGEGQSDEHLPKLSVAQEQFAAFMKKGLVAFKDWFQMTLPGEVLKIMTPEQAKRLLEMYLNRLPVSDNSFVNFTKIVGDAAKQASTDAMMIAKVGGMQVPRRRYTATAGSTEPTIVEDWPWRLDISLVPIENYYPDPTGNDLYEIHEVNMDAHVLLDLAEQGHYDKEAVREAMGQGPSRDKAEDQDEKEKLQDETTPPKERKQITVTEFWGTILNTKGEVTHRNVKMVLFNRRIVGLKPEPNPWWHQMSPFVRQNLLSTPHAVWGRALYDDAARLNIILDELFNLMVDGALASVWGIKQLRVDWLVDESQVSGGVYQGMTLVVKQDVPANAKVLEQVTEGEVPNSASLMFEMVNREFTLAAMSSELKMGQLPSREVLATEIIEMSQNQNLMMASIVGDVEEGWIDEILLRGWLNMMQHLDVLDYVEVSDAIGPATAQALFTMTPAQRFAFFGSHASVTVSGLSQTMQRVNEFQKIMALMQAIKTDPQLLQSFYMDFDPAKALQRIFRMLNIDPSDLQRDRDNPADVGGLQQFAQVVGPRAGNGPAAQNTGDSGSTAGSVNQQANPLTGLTG